MTPGDALELRYTSTGLARKTAELMAVYGYQPFLIVGIDKDGGLWVGMPPDVHSLRPIRELIKRRLRDLAEEVGLAAQLDDWQNLT